MDPPPWSGLSTMDALAVLNGLDLASLAGVGSSYLAPFVAGLAFYSFVLRRPAERLGVIAPIVFSATFALSFHMLLLAVFEIASVWSMGARFALWRVDLTGLAMLQVGVVPGLLAFSLLQDYGADRFVAGVLALLLHVAFLWVYNYIGILFPITATASHGLFSLEGNVGRLGVIGVTTSALLAGYGGVATPMIWIPQFNTWATSSDVRVKTRSVQIMQQRLAEAVHSHRLALQSAMRAGVESDAVQSAAAPGTSTFELDLDAAATVAVAGAAQSAPISIPPDATTAPGRQYHDAASSGHASTPSGLSASAWSTDIPAPVDISNLRISTDIPTQPDLDSDLTQALTLRAARQVVIDAEGGGGGGGFTTQAVIDSSATAMQRPAGSDDSPTSGKSRTREGAGGWCNCCDWSAFGLSGVLPRAERLGAMAAIHSTSEKVQSRRTAMRLELGALRELLDAAENVRKSRTWIGRLLVIGGWILIAVTSSKSLLAVRNVLFSMDPKRDPITTGVEWGLKYLHFPSWIRDLVQPASFMFVGVLVFTSTRGFLLSFAKMFRAVSSTTSTAHSFALGLSFVMSAYFVSTVLLMRMAMPEEYRAMLTSALGGVHFMFFHRWNDIVFLATVIVIGASSTLNSQMRGSGEFGTGKPTSQSALGTDTEQAQRRERVFKMA